MALSAPISSWLLANAERLDLRATQLSWVDDWVPDIFDFAVEITVDGVVYEGRGTADSEDLAFAKAGAEALERAVVATTNAKSSNGFAVHPDIKQASRLATQELLERDAYFCHWLTKMPFIALSDSSWGKLQIGRSSIASIAARLQGMGIELTHALMKTVGGSLAVVCVTRGARSQRPFGVIHGLGLGQLDEALCKAILECLRTTVAWGSGNYRGGGPLDRAVFARMPAPGPLEHERLGVAVESGLKMGAYLALSAGGDTAPGDAPAVQCTQVKLPEEIADAPVVAVRAVSTHLQDAVFGHAKEADINFQRLSKFAGRTMTLGDVCLAPHFFG